VASWDETEYVRRAADVASQSAVSKKPLNDVCQKVAQEEALNPEEIRTLVRLSNVAMFQHQFKAKDAEGAPDRHVEFEVGDPETVIQRMQQAAAQPPESANIMNDKLSHEVPDMMAAKRRGFEFDLTVTKVAEDAEVKPAKKDVAIIVMRKLANEYDIRRQSAGFRWEQKMAALVDSFKRAPGYGPSFVEFEKDAYAEFGDRVQFEMEDLRADLRVKTSRISPDERAKLAEHRITENNLHMKLLGEALDARADYVASEQAKIWVEKHSL